jgi:hypothetical protein
MSNEESKLVHGRRIQQKNRHIARQVRIRQAHKFPAINTGVDSPHRYHKTSGVTCGDSHCAMCGNPRKFFNEPTVQEKRHMQDVDARRDRHSNGTVPNDE